MFSWQILAYSCASAGLALGGCKSTGVRDSQVETQRTDPSPSPKGRTLSLRESEEPLASPQSPLGPDRGIFSEFDQEVTTTCPSWLAESPETLVSIPGSDTSWLVIDGVVVCQAERGETSTTTAKSAFDDQDGDGYPDAVDILRGAKKAVANGALYRNNYRELAYPGGDVPADEGVCTDVIVRALRNAGIDLQKEVHEDIAARPRAYPMVKKADPNIDHRRVRTLLPYFEEHSRALPTATDDLAFPYLPGDIVFMNTMGGPEPEHMGIVSDRLGKSGLPLLVNNWNDGTRTQEMDLLTRVPLTHRFRIARTVQVMESEKGVVAFARRTGLTLPRETRQIILVVTPLWTSSGGTLTRWARADDAAPFVSSGPRVAVRVGKAGLGLGRGLHGKSFLAPVRKAEGDKRAPAGMFELGTAFGRRRSLPSGTTWPYRQATERDYFVDEPDSPHYNTWVRLADGESMTESAERLTMYEWGLLVKHNFGTPVPGGGSAIFLHVWTSATTPTIGCTAMEENNLLDLLAWLRSDDKPVLIQAAGTLFQ